MTKKYIVVDKLGENIIIFSAGLSHNEVAGNMKVISAGFLDMWEGGVHCYGDSTTLGVRSRPGEDSILARVLLREDM